MRAGIIGLGYVGLTLAITAAECGVDVQGMEINSHIKECLRENKAHFFEPGLDALIKKHNGRKFSIVEEFDGDGPIDVFVITVGTPLKEGEKEPNFEYIKSALRSIEKVYDGRQLVILRSTVSVGTTRNIVLPFLAELCGKPEEEILVGMCPERTVEGKAVEELTHLPQIISGNNDQALETAQKFFRYMTPYVIPVSSLEEAELVKLYCNTYRDMNFAIGNAFCMAAQVFGVDGSSVINHANQGYPRSNIALAGFVAGPCLEKDAYILTNNMPECDSKNFIMSGRKFNESLEDLVVSWVKNKIGEPSGDRIVTVSGMAFKGQPETSDLRGSSSVYIAKKLNRLGYKLNLHDFVAIPSEMEELNLGNVFEDLRKACESASILLVLNNNKKYLDVLECEEIRKSKNDFAILDAWGMCKNLHNNENIDICTLGDFLIRERK